MLISSGVVVVVVDADVVVAGADVDAVVVITLTLRGMVVYSKWDRSFSSLKGGCGDGLSRAAVLSRFCFSWARIVERSTSEFNSFELSSYRYPDSGRMAFS